MTGHWVTMFCGRGRYRPWVVERREQTGALIDDEDHNSGVVSQSVFCCTPVVVFLIAT